MRATLMKKTFVLEGHGVVGGFLRNWPQGDGVYRYMPCRSLAHLRMGECLRATGSARCSYECDGRKVSFTVVAAKWGRLQLAQFKFDEIPVA
jgi:hypothetical protein